MIVLDTDHLTVLFFEDHSQREALLARLLASDDRDVAATVVSLEEQMRGWLVAIAREKLVERQVIAYRELAELFRFFESFYIGHFDDASVKQFKTLKASKVRIGTMDLKIASIALANDALLLTANHSDFSQVPGLRFENWLD